MSRPRAMAFASLVVALTALAPVRAHAVGDPTLKWYTITTEHFRINYHDGLEKVAQRVAAAAEQAHERLVPIMGHEPKARTEITISDETDDANGWALTVPFNQMKLWATAPADNSTMMDYDEWYLGLVIHEYAHVLHMDTYGGIAKVINSIFGKIYPPNNVQPRWIIEGLAVVLESSETTAGRLHSTQWDMMMRMAVLEQQFEPIDVIAIGPLGWPWGTAFYLYGSYFFQWVTDTYGKSVISDMSHDYGKALLPFGINRTIREITGKAWPELYDDWFAAATVEYGEVRTRVEAAGRREGMRITDTGQVDQSPRFSPDGDTIAYHSWDGHDRASILTLEIDDALASLVDHDPGAPELPERIDEWEPHRILETTGQGAVAWTPDGKGLVFARSEVFENWYSYHDLFHVDLEQESILRLTEGGRSRQPDVSPDGDLIAYTVNKPGTSLLAISEAGPHPEPLFTHDVGDFGQVYSPRFSPDGRSVAFSAWREGGLRDVHILDLDTMEVREITSDRFMDTGPVFDPQGRFLYFSSDRTGIANIFALDLLDGSLWQVTNVLSGAFEPEISPDSETLLYVGYHARGYDLYVMQIDSSQWTPANETAEDRDVVDMSWTVLDPVPQPKLYNPLRTLYPRYWMFTIMQDGYGQALSIYTTGADVAGHHSISGAVNIGLQGRTRVGYSLDYSLLLLPFDISIHHARSISPRWGLRIDDEWKTWPELRYTGRISFSFPMIRADWGQWFTLSYRIAWMQSDEPLRTPLDPNAALPHLPDRGWLSGPTLSWFFSNARGSGYGFSLEQGVSLWTSFHADLPALGSDYTAVSLTYGIAAYFEMPWVKHHVLALRFAGGYAWSNFERRGYYSVGGFPDQDILMDLVNQVRWLGVALRGYPPGVQWGDQYYLFNAEYRLPIVNVYRGLSTIPWQLNRIYLSILSDTGAAFPRRKPSWDALLTSVGAEIHITMSVGYWEGIAFKFGYARGLMDGGINDFYVILGTPF